MAWLRNRVAWNCVSTIKWKKSITQLSPDITCLSRTVKVFGWNFEAGYELRVLRYAVQMITYSHFFCTVNVIGLIMIQQGLECPIKTYSAAGVSRCHVCKEIAIICLKIPRNVSEITCCLHLQRRRFAKWGQRNRRLPGLVSVVEMLLGVKCPVVALIVCTCCRSRRDGVRTCDRWNAPAE
jgi:hypothetical protein